MIPLNPTHPPPGKSLSQRGDTLTTNPRLRSHGNHPYHGVVHHYHRSAGHHHQGRCLVGRGRRVPPKMCGGVRRRRLAKSRSSHWESLCGGSPRAAGSGWLDSGREACGVRWACIYMMMLLVHTILSRMTLMISKPKQSHGLAPVFW